MTTNKKDQVLLEELAPIVLINLNFRSFQYIHYPGNHDQGERNQQGYDPNVEQSAHCFGTASRCGRSQLLLNQKDNQHDDGD
jgi:hypothetical protein